MNYDFDRLCDNLTDYIGTAGQFIPIAMSEMPSIEYSSDSELLRVALQNGFDIDDYKIDDDF